MEHLNKIIISALPVFGFIMVVLFLWGLYDKLKIRAKKERDRQFNKYYPEEPKDMDFALVSKEDLKKIGKVVALIVVVTLVLTCFKIIPPNTVGIKFNVFTGIQQEVLREGLSIKSPLDRIYTINTEIQTVKVENVTGQTKDAQWVQMILDIKYRVNQKNAFAVFQNYRTLENVNSQLIIPLTQRAIEKVTTQYNVIDILGDQRNQVYSDIEVIMAEEMEKTGIDFVLLTMTDTDAGAAIEKAIEDEAVAKKRTETSVQEQERARVEAETKKINAEANADVQRIEAQGQADANKLLSESLTEQVLMKMEMDARLKHGWLEVTTNNAIVDATDK